MFGRQQNLLTDDYAPRERPSGVGADGGWFDLEDWVGPDHPSRRTDIAKLEAILANSGDYSLERTQGPTGYWGLALDKGIRAYQKRNGLAVDGVLRPGGPTIRHMEDAFGALLGGYAPPTAEDIDRHHETLDTGAPDVIAWRKPVVDFASIPDLPEIDQEADASNARMARAMLRTGDVEGYAPLMKKAIDEGGKRAFAEVADLASKLDEAQPGLGGKFASAVTGHLTKEQIEDTGLKVEPKQPDGTVQVALAPALVAGGSVATDVVAPLLGLGAGGALGYGAKKILEGNGTPDPSLPVYEGFSILHGDQNGAGTTTPVPAGPGSLGGSMEPPKPSDSIETFPADAGQKSEQAPPPALAPGERQKIVGKFVDELNVVFNEGSYIDNRGLPKTVELNNVVAKACAKAIGESEFPELIKQLGGASEGGDKQKYREERRVGTPGKGRQPDYLMGTVDGDDNIEHGAAINTVTTRADGSPISREQAQLDDLIKSNVIRFVDWLAKVGDGNPEDSFEDAYRKCKDGVKALEDSIRADIASGKRAVGK